MNYDIFITIVNIIPNKYKSFYKLLKIIYPLLPLIEYYFTIIIIFITLFYSNMKLIKNIINLLYLFKN